jgi:outer membrane lipoprotein-sorting protein
MKTELFFLAAVIFFTAASATQPVYTEADLAVDVINKVLIRQSEITSLKGDVNMTYTAGGDSQTFRVGFARVPPDKARLEVVGLLGELLFVLTADGERMMVNSKGERKAVVCAATRENLTALLGMDLGGDINEVLDWIEGRVPVYAESVATGEVSAVGEYNDDGTVTITWTFREGETPIQVLNFEPDDGRVVFSRVFDADGQAETDIYYKDFKERDGLMMPYSVDVNRKDNYLNVRFNELKINESVRDGAFSVEPPKNSEVFYWDDLIEGDDPFIEDGRSRD